MDGWASEGRACLQEVPGCSGLTFQISSQQQCPWHLLPSLPRCRALASYFPLQETSAGEARLGRGLLEDVGRYHHPDPVTRSVCRAPALPAHPPCLPPSLLPRAILTKKLLAGQLRGARLGGKGVLGGAGPGAPASGGHAAWVRTVSHSDSARPEQRLHVEQAALRDGPDRAGELGVCLPWSFRPAVSHCTYCV